VTPSIETARLLIVDDQPSNVKLLEHTLRRAGYVHVSATTDPREVAAMHGQHGFHLILLDLQMPRMDGFEVMDSLREIRKSLPVAILVISADPAQLKAAMAGGADSFLSKPFRLPDVVDRVEVILKACATSPGPESAGAGRTDDAASSTVAPDESPSAP
jgi:adenylate cyclase